MKLKKLIGIGAVVILVGMGCEGGKGTKTEKADNLISQGDFDTAREEYLKVLEKNPENTDALSGVVIADVLWVVDKLNNILTNSILVGALSPQADIGLLDLVLSLAGTNLADLSQRVDEIDAMVKKIEDVAGQNFLRELPKDGIPVQLGKERMNTTLGNIFLDVKLYGKIGFPEIEAVGAVASAGKAILNLLNSLDTTVPSTFITNILNNVGALGERMNNDPIGLLRMLPTILGFEKETFLCWNLDLSKHQLYYDIPDVLSTALKRLSNVLKKADEVFGANPVDQSGYLVGLYDGGDGKPGGGDDTKPLPQSGRDYLKLNVKGKGRDTLDRDFDGNKEEIINMGEGGVEIKFYFPSGFNQEFLNKLNSILTKLSDILSRKSTETKISIDDINDLLEPLHIVKDNSGNVRRLPNVLRIDISKLFAQDVPCLRDLLIDEAPQWVDPYDGKTKRAWIVEGETNATSIPEYATTYVKHGDSPHFGDEIPEDGAAPTEYNNEYPKKNTDTIGVITSALIYLKMKDPSLHGALEIDLCPLKDYPNTTTAVAPDCTPGNFSTATQFSFNNVLGAAQIIFEVPYLKIELPQM